MTEVDEGLKAELLALAKAVATEASELVATRAASISTLDTKSSTTDIVTDVDRAAETLIVERIRTARPDDGIVGEEGTGVVGTSGIDWVVDPIDGTTSFVYSYPGYSVSIAAATDAGTIVGAVADPVHGHLYSAALGMGAHRSSTSGSSTSGSSTSGSDLSHPLTVNKVDQLGSALVATGFGYEASRRAKQAVVLTGLLPEVRDIRRSGSAALDLCFVACGQVDAYFEVGLNMWDLAAGLLIAQEAGASSIAEFPDDHPPFIVASAPGIADALFERLDAHDARLQN